MANWWNYISTCTKLMALNLAGCWHQKECTKNERLSRHRLLLFFVIKLHGQIVNGILISAVKYFLGNPSSEMFDTLHKKIKFSIKDFIGKCDQICSFLWIWSFLLKKSWMKNFILFVQWQCSKYTSLKYRKYFWKLEYLECIIYLSVTYPLGHRT